MGGSFDAISFDMKKTRNTFACSQFLSLTLSAFLRPCTPGRIYRSLIYRNCYNIRLDKSRRTYAFAKATSTHALSWPMAIRKLRVSGNKRELSAYPRNLWI